MSLNQFLRTTRDDVIPGYILSKPRLAEYGAAEEFFTRQYIARVRDLIAGADSDLRKTMMSETMTQLREGMFSLDSPAFRAALLRPENFALALRLLLAIKHPQITTDTAAIALLPADDQESVISAVLALWGFRPIDELPSTPQSDSGNIEWGKIIFALTQPPHNLSEDEISALTLDQLRNRTSGGKEESGGAVVGQREVADRQTAAQRACFDMICREERITPAAFALADVSALIKKYFPAATVPADIVDRAKAYAVASTIGPIK